MGLRQNLYFMSLVGGIAGLLAWVISAVATVAATSGGPAWLPDLVALIALGALIGGMNVGFMDKWSGNRAQARFVLVGSLIGALAGLTAYALDLPIAAKVGPAEPTLSRVIAWTIAGSLIGLGLGFRWMKVNSARPAHGFSGGLCGGLIGGLLFANAGTRLPDLSQATAFVLTGAGISFGITLAPILFRCAVVEFVSSGDPRAQSKFGRSHKEWEIADGDTYVIGSQPQRSDATTYRPEIEIYLPDAAVAPRHATLFGRDGRFILARHSQAAGPSGLARYPLRVRGKTVVEASELRHSDDILIGRTALKFVARPSRAKS